MKFKTLIIVTYARSGSTLLQGVLNSMPKILIRGENQNFYYPLYLAYTRLVKAGKVHGDWRVTKPKDSWYGFEMYKPEDFLKSIRELSEKYLLGEENKKRGLCYGFKEVRYYEAKDDLDGYLKFLRMIYPDLGIIFNTRNHKDTIDSQVKKKWAVFEECKKKSFSKVRLYLEKRKAIKKLERDQKIMREYYEKNREHSFWIDYENVCNNDSKVEKLHEFIGVPYDKKYMDEILKTKYGY